MQGHLTVVLCEEFSWYNETRMWAWASVATRILNGLSVLFLVLLKSLQQFQISWGTLEFSHERILWAVVCGPREIAVSVRMGHSWDVMVLTETQYNTQFIRSQGFRTTSVFVVPGHWCWSLRNIRTLLNGTLIALTLTIFQILFSPLSRNQRRITGNEASQHEMEFIFLSLPLNTTAKRCITSETHFTVIGNPYGGKCYCFEHRQTSICINYIDTWGRNEHHNLL